MSETIGERIPGAIAACEKHRQHPFPVYSGCVGCDLERDMAAEKAARLLGTIVFTNVIYREPGEREWETVDGERTRIEENERELIRWGEIVQALIDGRITAEKLAEFNCNAPMARRLLAESMGGADDAG